MATYEFLSDDWINETRRIREEFLKTHPQPDGPKLRLNLAVTDVPFGPGEIAAHMDSSSGQPDIELGHLAKVDATITVGYETAKTLFVDGRMSAAMEAMQLGRIKVKGNMFKLLGLGKLGKGPGAEEITAQIKAITA